MPYAEGLRRLQCARAVFDPTTNAGERTIAAHVLAGDTLPDNAIVLGGFVEVNETFTSAGADAGTIAIHVNAANDVVNAVAINNATDWDAGLHAIIPKFNTPETTSIKLTADRAITATVGAQALTAGRLNVYLFWVEGE